MKVGLWGSIEAQVFALVSDDADLFEAAFPAVVPEEPLVAVENRVGFVAGIVVPLAGAGARSLPGARWEFCWICFAEPAGHSPRIAVPAPTVTHTDPGPIAWALFSLQRELRQGRQKVIIDTLLQLLNFYVQRITSLHPEENHLWKLWDKVAQSTEHPWTGEEMARLIHVSPRHLLRLCKKESGHTLREQLTHIRMTKAASLLQDRRLKLHAIAEAVGHQDAFAFSKAFKRWCSA